MWCIVGLRNNMAKIIIPNPGRKRALILVDLQEGFLKDDNRHIITPIQKVMMEGKYDLIVEAIFHAEPGSLWDKQTEWTFPLRPTTSEIQKLLGSDTIKVTKTTKSVFKGDKDLEKILKEKGIEEVHIVGLDTNDCAFATAQESFDLGFFTYVLEECVAASGGEELHEAALKILRHLDMTNHSELIKTHQII